MVFVQIEQAIINSLSKLYEQNEEKNQSKSQQILHLKCDNKSRILSTIHNDEITNLDYFFYLWNLFNVTPVDSDIISVGPVVMDKRCLFQYFSQEKCCNVWFTEHPPYIDNRNISSLILFLETFIEHIFQSNLEVHHMEALSCLILLSWWNIAFGHSEPYQIIAYELYHAWIRLIPRIVENSSLIIDQFSSYPEHLNLFIINLLRIYVDHNFQKENVWKLSKDAASQMTGIHASVNMHGLSGIYRKSIEQLSMNNTKSLSAINTLNQTVSINNTCLAIVEILKKLVRLGLADCLKQSPDLPIISFADKQIIERFNMVRDYLLVRASRLLAYELESNVNGNYIPKQFTCLVHVTASKHLISELLNISLCKSEKISHSKNPHIDLISWTLEHNLNVTDYAFWCVTSIDVKDIEAINYLLSRLLPHAKLLAKDHLFCFSLILHLDRVRKAALPDNEHIKLLRAVFEHLSISSKCDLLTSLQSSLKNSNRSTPLPNSTVHFQTRIRQLFNRLVVSNVNSSDDNYDNSQQVLNLFNKDFLLDCELLLFTNPVRFLVELIRLPVNRKCPHSLTAVHQLLDQLLYAFQVPINFSTGTKSLPETNHDKFTMTISSEQQVVHSTIFQEVILIDWSNRKSYLDISLFGHEDPFDELNNGNLFSVNFQYEEEKNKSDLSKNNKLYQFDMFEEAWSSSKLSENPLLNTIVYLFKKPNCFIQINNIMKYFLKLLENNIMNKSSSHIDHLTSTTHTTIITTNTTNINNNQHTFIQHVHIRIFIHVLYSLIKDKSIIKLLDKINLNELIEQFIQLFNILFLNQFNTTTTNNNSSSNNNDSNVQLMNNDIQYFISNEVDIILFELIHYFCFNQDNNHNDNHDPLKQIKNNLNLIYKLKQNIQNSINIYNWYKYRCFYLFNIIFTSSIATINQLNNDNNNNNNNNGNGNNNQYLEDIYQLRDQIFNLSIELNEIQMNSLENFMDINLFYKNTGIQFKAISVVPSLTGQTEDCNSLLPSNAVVGDNHIKSQMMISPRLLYFIFELATVSNTLCSEVLKSIINKSLKSNGQLLDPISKISSGHLIIAIQLFLRKIVKSKQWKCWERLYFLLYKLLKAGVLVYPVPNLINDNQETNDNTPSRLFYLLDWSKLCGSFDLFTLTSDLFNLWCMSLEILSDQLLNPFQPTNLSHDNSNKLYHRNTEFYILCHSLCDLVSYLSSVISLHSTKNIDRICNNDENNNNDGNTVNSDADIISSLKTNQFIQYSKQLAIHLLDQLSNRLSNNLISNLLIKSNSQLNVSDELNRLKQTILLVQDIIRT
ncbi:unnamed protein product [Schistosoma rodhaini]|uniref:Uncharacterized protein n=1 Tax=Schistosoma rodhaini TaxID=6188 RepID=A0AA85ERM2_9TREM|nr:unnamed protein product [Schistosoma rodhaini]